MNEPNAIIANWAVPFLLSLLLELFLEKKNKIVTYQEIENYVWEGDYVSSESIRSLIRRLRKIFENKYIETVIDVGYKFNSN